MEYGGNISTRAGEGDAYIFKWEPMYRTLGMIQQRDLMHQQSIKSNALKAELQFQEGSKGIRPVDMPEFKQYADVFRNAAMMLEDRKLQRDPARLSEVRKLKDEAFFNAMTLAQQSKEALAFKTNIAKEVMHKQGIGFQDPETLQKLYDEYDNTPTSQLSKRGLNTPVPYLLPPDIIPQKDHEDFIFGRKAKRFDRTPVFADDKKTVKGWESKEYEAYENDEAAIAERTISLAALSPSAANMYKQRFAAAEQANPGSTLKTIEQAEAVTKTPLPKDPYGYMAAINILQGQKRYTGKVDIEDDPEFTRKQKLSDQVKLINYRTQKAKEVAAFRSSLKGAKGGDEEEDDVDAGPLYDAALDNDEDSVRALGSALSENTGGTLVPVSRNTILTPSKNKQILEAFDLNIEPVTQVRVPKEISKDPQKIRDFYVDRVLTAIKDKTGVNIDHNDINGSIVPILVRKESKANYNADTKKFTGTSSVVVTAKEFSPKKKTKQEFNSEFSQEWGKIAKWKAEKQAGKVEKAKQSMGQRAVNKVKSFFLK